MSEKRKALALLIAAEVLTMSLWFVSAAVLPQMRAEADIAPAWQAALSAAVQAGFVLGALGSAALGLADRFDPRRVLAAGALAGAAANAGLIWAPPGGALAVGLRLATGAALAAVYPVGMKIAVGWGERDRGLLVGLLVGGLTLGSAAPHLLAGAGAWRETVALASALAAAGAALGLATRLGPHHAQAARFDPHALRLAWSDRRIRAAFLGYLGHMWELYAMWAWIGAALAASFAARMAPEAAGEAARLAAFCAIAAGALGCAPAGWLADRIGKARLAAGAMVMSGACALAAAGAFGGPAWLLGAIATLWGVAVIADSAQFSALIADFAPPAAAGSLMTLQTALGFALTVPTVQLTPLAAAALGWPATLALMAAGPALGVAALTPLLRRR
ncbi:MFS transporter [Oceanicella actignis]|uniref:MFS transporter n=1 Tax=Oceanicella actignis TaxID=1189325 RepID=UPI0011E89824|nr:MFS transporter [Oceanicella actignis]TYO85232.1 nitrate/nitrite transporter NarK [Oceanicella actignis]